MKSAPKHPFEEKRLASLQLLEILDTLEEKDFDEITLLASQICLTPIALISLIDENRQWFKSKVGMAASETPREFAFCAHAILQENVFTVEDSLKDERFHDNPLVTGGPKVHFYAGAPLLSPEGFAIGTLCVIDNKSRSLSELQKKSLQALSNQVTRLLDLKLKLKEEKNLVEKIHFNNTALNSITEGIVLQDITGKILDFNSAALKILDQNEQQLTGKTSLDPSWRAVKENGEEFPGLEHPAMLCLKTGQPQKNIIMGINSQNQGLRWIKINSIPLYAKDNKTVTHAVTSFSDITDDLKIQQELLYSETQLRNIIDTFPGMIGNWNKDLVNLNANAAYYNFFGKNPKDTIGKHMKDVLGLELFEKNIPYINRALNNETISFERDIILKSGKILHTLANYIPYSQNNKVAGFLAVVIDISQVKKLEIQLIESARLSSLGEMANGMAHEINNPLTIIKGKINIIKDQLQMENFDKAKMIKYCDTIDQTTDRIAHIITILRSYSKDASNDLFETTSISTIIANSLELCREKFNASAIKIILEDQTNLNIECKPAQISQALINLLHNAYVAISLQSEKWIKIKVDHNLEEIHLAISDSGQPIPKEVREKMMHPFFTTKEVGNGSGLGLTIVKNIIESHHGTLTFDEKLKNTTFVITLPKIQKKLS